MIRTYTNHIHSQTIIHMLSFNNSWSSWDSTGRFTSRPLGPPFAFVSCLLILVLQKVRSSSCHHRSSKISGDVSSMSFWHDCDCVFSKRKCQHPPCLDKDLLTSATNLCSWPNLEWTPQAPTTFDRWFSWSKRYKTCRFGQIELLKFWCRWCHVIL